MNDIHTQIISAIIETERLWLKELNGEVLDALFSAYPDNYIIDFLGLSGEAELAIERERFAAGYTTHQISFRNFLLIEKESCSVIGRAGFHTWFVPHRRAEIGYAITSDALKSKGYMTEALVAIIAFGFNTLNLNRVEALIGTHNVPSRRLAARLGFTSEGVLREHYCKNGIIEDSEMFALLRRDYCNFG